MAKRVTKLTFFFSGSSEVEAEQGALKAVVADLSEILEKRHGVTIGLIGWPDTIRPGVGRDPQKRYQPTGRRWDDIYVGVEGARILETIPGDDNDGVRAQ